MRDKSRKLLVKFSCGHAQVFDPGQEPRDGNVADCRKCGYKTRTVVERSWVAAKESA